ncbi:MAG: GNAT family N-acetyltransferase [Bacillota bacterium]
MSWNIRPFAEADYEGLARIWSVCNQETFTVEALRWQDRPRDDRCKQGRWVAEVGGEVVGFGEYRQDPAFYHPQKFEVVVMLLPDHRRQGIGSALYGQVTEALAPFDPVTLNAATGEEWLDGQRFLAARGFTEKMRMWESHLDVQGFDPGPWRGVLKEVEAQGYQIRSYAELSGEPDAAQRLYRLVTEVRRDVPSTDPWQDVTYETWSRIFENPHFFPEAYFIGIKDGEWVGLSALWKADDEGVLTTGLTAVQRSHRGTGLAKAMKVWGIGFAREQGFQKIKTWNESNNQRMLAINLKLGFARKPAWVMYQKQFRAEE